jgi:hypothetical protein
MKLFRGISVISLVIVTVSACSFLKKGGDDGGAEGGLAAADEAGAATTPPPAAGAAANEDDIARFPDEAKLPDVPATVRRPYNVRDAPPAGGIVAGVNPGQGVTTMATRGNYTLITFDDARSGKKLMGWVHKDAFVPQIADAGIVEPKCAAGEIALISDNAGICGKACDKDADCPSGQACHGSAAKFNKGKAGDSVQVCTVFHPHDAGAGGAKPDAGSVVTTVDAGIPAADAGSKLAPQTVVVAPSQMGACPDNAVLVKKDNKCHVKCPKAADCDKFNPKGFCGTCDGQRVCSPDRGFCGN